MAKVPSLSIFGQAQTNVWFHGSRYLDPGLISSTIMATLCITHIECDVWSGWTHPMLLQSQIIYGYRPAAPCIFLTKLPFLASFEYRKSDVAI